MAAVVIVVIVRTSWDIRISVGTLAVPKGIGCLFGRRTLKGLTNTAIVRALRVH